METNLEAETDLGTATYLETETDPETDADLETEAYLVLEAEIKTKTEKDRDAIMYRLPVSACRQVNWYLNFTPSLSKRARTQAFCKNRKVNTNA